MKFSNILVVCVGNICRSPLGAAMLSLLLRDVTIVSAGIAAVGGSHADPNVQAISLEYGLDLSLHRSQLISDSVVNSADLILAMDRNVLDEMRRMWPHASGKTFLFDHWSDRVGIEDPYGRSFEQHRATASVIANCAIKWLEKVQAKHPS